MIEHIHVGVGVASTRRLLGPLQSGNLLSRERERGGGIKRDVASKEVDSTSSKEIKWRMRDGDRETSRSDTHQHNRMNQQHLI
jgi:hypothetical protein